MSQLPPRGTGLETGTARVERGLGIPLTEAERLRRHYGLQVGASPYTALIIAALAAASGAAMIALSLKGRG